ncbi:hypothetical protein C8Q74DRAFT_1318951 [Fomes fomentarius]|nr:hypothetical protein C8Q74DRAFT_1318951 [Fomes fomentarius]
MDAQPAFSQPHVPLLSNSLTLGVFSHILVVSRSTRLDRRSAMEQLRAGLGIQWTYIDALSYEDSVVEEIGECVRSQRKHAHQRQFNWPSGLDELIRSPTPFTHNGSMEWLSPTMPCAFPLPAERPASPTNSGLIVDTMHSRASKPSPAPPLTCAIQDRTHGVRFKPTLPSYMLLTPPKLACWYSHLDAIMRFAGLDESLDWHERPPSSDAVLILEDDVDMERDIESRLGEIWEILPRDWDIVFLGHCWSKESHYPALRNTRASKISSRYPKMAVHPSFAPKCSHAYALSRAGARRILLHLLHPPFLYSRALDQAFSWLVQSGRLKAYSVVPSVVVQHKLSRSDIDGGEKGLGSGWKEELVHGVLT